MANLARFQVAWSNPGGGAGLNTFYSWQATGVFDLNPALHALYASLAAYIPNSSTISFPTVASFINDVDGTLTGSAAVSSQSNVTGGSAATFSSPAGVGIRWSANAVIPSAGPGTRAHQLTGRTFIVPAVISAMTNGNPSATMQSTINGYVNTYLAAVPSQMYIWSRPVVDPKTNVTIRPGSSAAVVGGKCMAKAVVLRSRRD